MEVQLEASPIIFVQLYPRSGTQLTEHPSLFPLSQTYPTNLIPSPHIVTHCEATPTAP